MRESRWIGACVVAMLACGACWGQGATTLSIDNETVTILRDSYGAPHVFASTRRGLFYGNGYAVAEDRLGQMELYRRTARGEMAGLIGASAVNADKETRIDGYTEAEREAQFARLSPELKTMLSAYADGVNAYLDSLKKSASPKAILVANFPGKFDPGSIRPWRVTDSISIGQMMARRFGGGEGGELRNMLLFSFLKNGNKESAYKIFNDVAWRNDPTSPTTVPASEDKHKWGGKTHWTDSAGKVAEGPTTRHPYLVRDSRSGPSPATTRTSPPPRPSSRGTRDLLLTLRTALTGRKKQIPRQLGMTSRARTQVGVVRRSAGIPDSFDPQAAIRAADILDQKARMELANRLGLMTKWGSYCFAVTKEKSATGNAMLVGGPQMGFRTPQIAHEIHLSGAGIDCIGMGFAGIAGVLIGHNKNLAWSTTTSVNDETDVFIETLNPADQNQYRFKGEWKTMEKRVETIDVARGEQVTLEVFRTIHGPVVQWDKAHNLAYSRMAAYWDKEADTTDAIYRFHTARNVKEFGDACALITTGHNFFCATQDGDIGFWFCGRTPIRAAGVDPRLPTPGEGDHEWRGMMKFSDQPWIVNPKQGFVANWNNKPAIWWDNYDTPAWGQIWHSARIAELLAAKTKITAEDLRNVLLDVGTNDYTAEVFLPVVSAALKNQTSTLSESARQAAGYLEAWNHQATEGSVAKTIFDAWLQQTREDLFGKTFGFINLTSRDLFNTAMQPSLMLHVLLGKKSPVPAQYDYLGGKTPDQLMAEALNKAVEKLAKDRGPQMNAWRFTRGKINFNPLPGIPATDRGTYIQIVECSKPMVRGVNILPPGQSERTDSPHFGDQREIAGWFFFKPMLTQREEIEKSK